MTVTDPDSSARLLADLEIGLAADPPSIPCIYLYDERGAELFTEICRLPEYYPTRTELAIMPRVHAELPALLADGVHLVEYGSGEGTKTAGLLAALPVARYSPVDIAAPQLARTAERLAAEHPDIAVEPVVADFTTLSAPLPEWPENRPRLVYFPGSTIGNFAPAAAADLLAAMAGVAGPDGALLVGFDRVKDPAVLEAAYDDAAGVTAAFNRNLIARLARELDWPLDPAAFAHHAPYDREAQRIEMRLVAERPQTLPLPDGERRLAPGDYIVTEHSHKFTWDAIEQLAAGAGLAVAAAWHDEREWFSVVLLRPLG